MLVVLNSAAVNAENQLAVCHLGDTAARYSPESSWQREILPQRQRRATGPLLVLVH